MSQAPFPVKELQQKISKSEFMRYSLDSKCFEANIDQEDRYEIEVLRIIDILAKYDSM